MRPLLLAELLLLACAAPPAIDVPAEVKPSGQYARLLPKTDAVAVTYVGLDGVEPIPAELLKDPRLFLLDARGLAPGKYRFVAVAAGERGEQARADFVVVVHVPPPPPVPPVPPTPPTPDPPSPAPIPGEGLRVLIVYETADLAGYQPGQREVLYAKAVRDYLNAKCSRANDWPEWRVLDKDAPVGAEAAVWQDAMRRPRKSLPWLIVSDGKAGYEGPLPSSVADMLALLKKYGG